MPRIDNFYFAAQARWDGRKEKEDGEEARKEGDITYWIKPGVASEGDGKGKERSVSNANWGGQRRRREEESERKGWILGFRFGEGCSGCRHRHRIE